MKRLNLKKYPKVKLIDQPSNIHYLKSISQALNVDLFIKRDDLLPIGLGGNKLRKLEYLLGEAKNQKSTHIFTIGATQSNHARMTAVTAKMNGFQVELFLKKSVPIIEPAYFQNGNIIINNIIDAKIHQVQDNKSAYKAIQEREKELLHEGGKAYTIPIGGSNAIGTLGYIDCYYEILKQENELGVNFNWITSASGSGGTHAGLIAGKLLSNTKNKVKAYHVEPDQGELADHTLKITQEVLKLCNSRKKVKNSDILISDEYAGNTYGIPEDYHIETIKYLAKHEGVLLDPVYTSKAFLGLIMDIKNNIIKKGEKVLFIHTGGTPGIFAYPQYF